MREYNMEEMKKTIGHNIVALRRGAGLTQSELAAQLNYSDKAVSKWECGDAVPDILTLTRLTELFGVSLDWLVKSRHEVDMPSVKQNTERRHTVIILLSAILVWLIATACFVLVGGTVDNLGEVWLAFIYAIPISALVVSILSAVWKRKIAKYISLSICSWGVILSVFLTLVVCAPTVFEHKWLLFLIGIPGQALIVLWPHLFPYRKSKRKAEEDSDDR